MKPVQCRSLHPNNKQEMTNVKKIVTAFLLLALTGCTVGPNYKRPKVETPATYRGLTPEEIAQSDAKSFADEKWWDVFQDEQLKELIKTALEQNYEDRKSVV